MSTQTETPFEQARLECVAQALADAHEHEWKRPATPLNQRDDADEYRVFAKAAITTAGLFAHDRYEEIAQALSDTHADSYGGEHFPLSKTCDARYWRKLARVAAKVLQP